MKLFFGKISKKFDTKQIEDGYYQAPRDSGWFGDLAIGDYVYLIGGDKIQFWRAKEWRVVDGSDRLYFEILNSDLGINVNDLISLKFLEINKALIVLTSRSARGKAFFALTHPTHYTVNELAETSFYQNETLYRSIRLVNKNEVDPTSSDIQLYLDNDVLNIVHAAFFVPGILNLFRDNLKYRNQGSKFKDKTLSQVHADLGTGKVFDRTEMSMRAFYDAFFCDYKEKQRYFLVGAFWNDEEDKTQEFIDEGRWENGYDDKFLEETKAIEAGSLIAIKSAYVRERVRSVMKIKARGIVLKNEGDGHKLEVEWEENFLPFEVDFGGYMRTVKEVTNKDHISAIWENETEKLSMENTNRGLLDILKYKKQIILQGPPGTGKTKLAKELAAELIGKTNTSYNEVDLTDLEIEKMLSLTTTITSIAGNTSYKIKSIDGLNKEVVLQKSSEKEDTTSFKKIQESYKSGDWRIAPIDNDERRAKAIAKYIYDQIKAAEDFVLSNSEQIKVIQFHPSYSYEDFVRGITVKTEDGKPSYVTENRIFGTLCDKALENYNASKKSPDIVSKELGIKERFDQFKENISDELEKGNSYAITPSVVITEVENDAFRYSGPKWEKDRRMKFADILEIYLANVDNKNSVENLITVSGLAKQHSTYFLSVKRLFHEFLLKQPLSSPPAPQTIPLLNFVLIVDEINRANLSSVLGELIYALEYRGDEVKSIYSLDDDKQKGLIIPPNLYIIGTMNTADRSVGHIDYAIRRRFAFVDVQPKDLSDGPGIAFHQVLFTQVSELFMTNLSGEFDKKDVQLGHSYFIDKSYEGGPMQVRLEYEIKPILREYVKDGILIGEGVYEKIESLSV